MSAPPKKIAILSAFAAIYVIWGSTYLAIFFAIQSIPPFLMAGTRFFLAGIFLYGFARLRGASRPAPGTWRDAFIIGACLLLFGNGGVTLAEKWVPTGLAAVMVASVPIYFALLGWITGTTPKPSAIVWLGLVGGLIGVGMLFQTGFASPSGSSSNHLVLGMTILLLGSLLWSAGSLYSRRAKNSPSPFLAAGQQMLCGGALLIMTGAAIGEQRGFEPHHITWLSIGAFAYLVVIGALVGFPAYIFLLRHCDPTSVATYAYVNPVVAMLLGTTVAGESFTMRTLLGAGLIIGSVALVITVQQLASIRARTAPMVAPDCAR